LFIKLCAIEPIPQGIAGKAHKGTLLVTIRIKQQREVAKRQLAALDAPERQLEVQEWPLEQRFRPLDQVINQATRMRRTLAITCLLEKWRRNRKRAAQEAARTDRSAAPITGYWHRALQGIDPN
jgi:hypothetical protein